MASASFAPLRHRGFALALGSNFVSTTGTWMQSVALGIYLQTTTHNAEWLGLLTVAAWLPAPPLSASPPVCTRSLPLSDAAPAGQGPRAGVRHTVTGILSYEQCV